MAYDPNIGRDAATLLDISNAEKRALEFIQGFD